MKKENNSRMPLLIGGIIGALGAFGISLLFGSANIAALIGSIGGVTAAAVSRKK